MAFNSPTWYIQHLALDKKVGLARVDYQIVFMHAWLLKNGKKFSPSLRYMVVISELKTRGAFKLRGDYLNFQDAGKLNSAEFHKGHHFSLNYIMHLKLIVPIDFKFLGTITKTIHLVICHKNSFTEIRTCTVFG